MVSEVESFPYEALFERKAFGEFLRHGGPRAQILTRAHRLYEVRNPAGEIILAAGVSFWSMIRPPELWMLLARPFKLNLRESLMLAREALQLPVSQYPGLTSVAHKDDRAGNSFVKHCGWRPTGRARLGPDSDSYIQYGVF